MARGTIRLALVVAALLAVFALKHLLLELPAVPEASAAATAAGRFDADRAYGRLERILAGNPVHWVDSPGSDAVRDRLVAELRAAGLDPRVADHPSCNSYARSRAINCARIRDVVATIGPPTGRHLLLVSHYDSNIAGPGASDDGIGVAAMIEVAALLRGERLQRPVTFLFNEGEETGLNGARAFLDHDPSAPLVDILINLEARGTTGPAIMFETSRPNAAAIRAFARGTRRPFANSLSTDFYRLIPNSTDVAVFEERPWTILNFAIIGNETRYHSAGDDLAALDRRSLQHIGDEALGIARAVAAGGAPTPEGTRIYADFHGLFLVTLPLLPGLALLGALTLVFAAAALRRRALGRPLLTVTAAVLTAGLLAFAADFAVGLLRPADYWRGVPLVAFLAFYAIALLGCLAAVLTIGRRAEKSGLRIAAWLLLLVVGAAACATAPGAAIYFLFPPLLVVLAALLSGAAPRSARIAAAAGAVLLFATFTEMLTLIELLLIDGPYWILAPLAALAILPLLVEALPEQGEVRRPLILWPAAAAALALWAAVLVVPRATADRQQLFTIEYLQDAAAGTAWWAVSNKSVPLPAGWSALGEWRLREVPYSTRRRWTAPAPLLPVPRAAVEVVGSRPLPEGRLVSIVLRMNGADTISIKLPPEARMTRAGLPGRLRAIGGRDPDAPHYLRCAGRACEGMRLDLLLGGGAPVAAEVVGARFALPPAARPLLAARPAHSRPQYSPDASYAVTRTRL